MTKERYELSCARGVSACWYREGRDIFIAVTIIMYCNQDHEINPQRLPTADASHAMIVMAGSRMQSFSRCTFITPSQHNHFFCTRVTYLEENAKVDRLCAIGYPIARSIAERFTCFTPTTNSSKCRGNPKTRSKCIQHTYRGRCWRSNRCVRPLPGWRWFL